MIGTIFSVKLAILLIPPMKIIPAITATQIPTASFGTWNALLNAAPIELDCTIFPINPRARMIATEKKPARNFPNPPLNTYFI